jgi:transposase
VDSYLQIRLLHRDGQSIRQIAKKLGHSRDTVRKALVQAAPVSRLARHGGDDRGSESCRSGSQHRPERCSSGCRGRPRQPRDLRDVVRKRE